MRKTFALLATMLLMAVSMPTARAQAVMNDDSFPWRFGLQLGINSATFSGSQFSTHIGWNFGACALYDLQNFIPNSYASAALSYMRKGANAGKEDFIDHGHQYKFRDATYNLHYIEAPIHFGYGYELNDLVCLLAETGPYFAMRLTSSLRSSEFSIDGVDQGSLSDVMKDYYDDLRRFDVGWGIDLGVMLSKKYQFMVGCDWGLCEAVPDMTGRNVNVTFKLSVYFD